MSIATLPPEAGPAERLLTAADVAALPDELPSGPAYYELDNGRLIVMPPAGDSHGGSEVKLGAALLIQGEWRGLGKAHCGDVGILLWRDPDRLVGADALFIAKLPAYSAFAGRVSLNHSRPGGRDQEQERHPGCLPAEDRRLPHCRRESRVARRPRGQVPTADGG